MRHQRGFTLMELMVAGAVITALSVVGISFLVSERESGRIKQVQIEMLNIADGCIGDQFHIWHQPG